MLTQFKSEFHFNKLHVTVWAEPLKRFAEMSVTYDRRLVGPAQAINLAHVSPETVETYMREHLGELGSRLEAMEANCRMNARAAA